MPPTDPGDLSHLIPSGSALAAQPAATNSAAPAAHTRPSTPTASTSSGVSQLLAASERKASELATQLAAAEARARAAEQLASQNQTAANDLVLARERQQNAEAQLDRLQKQTESLKGVVPQDILQEIERLRAQATSHARELTDESGRHRNTRRELQIAQEALVRTETDVNRLVALLEAERILTSDLRETVAGLNETVRQTALDYDTAFQARLKAENELRTAQGEIQELHAARQRQIADYTAIYEALSVRPTIGKIEERPLIAFELASLAKQDRTNELTLMTNAAIPPESIQRIIERLGQL